MLSLLSGRWFQSKIAAEIKAQYPDQSYVNRIIGSDEVLRELLELKANSDFSNLREGNFLFAVSALDTAIHRSQLSDDDIQVSAKLLLERMNRVNHDPISWNQHKDFYDKIADRLMAFFEKTSAGGHNDV